MSTVFANDPSAAFALSEDLNQRRVSNYLNSIAANRQAQQQSWQAQAQQAAQQQAQDQFQQKQMFDLAHAAITQQNQQQNFGLSQQNLAEIIRHNMADENKPNASQNILDWKKGNEAQDNASRAIQSENIAKYLNDRAGLNQLTQGLPTEAATKDAASEDFWHWPPFSDKAVNAKRAAFSGSMAEPIPGDILSQVDFTQGKDPVAFRKAIADAIAARAKPLDAAIPKAEPQLNYYVTFRNGRFEPNFPVNPLLRNGGTPSPPPPDLPVAPGQDIGSAFDAWVKQNLQ